MIAALTTLWPAAARLLIRFTGPELWWLVRVAHWNASVPGATAPVSPIQHFLLFAPRSRHPQNEIRPQPATTSCPTSPASGRELLPSRHANRTAGRPSAPSHGRRTQR